MVETALVLPVVLILVAGVIEYSWMLLVAQEATDAARRGARLAILPDATNAEVQASVTAMMAAANLASSGYTMTISPGDVSAVLPGDPIEVSVVVPFANVAIVNAPLIPMPGNIRGAVTMAKEGP